MRRPRARNLEEEQDPLDGHPRGLLWGADLSRGRGHPGSRGRRLSELGSWGHAWGEGSAWRGLWAWGHMAGYSRAWDGFQKVLCGNQQETARVLLRGCGGLERGREGARAAGDRCVGQWAGRRACRGHQQGRGPCGLLSALVPQAGGLSQVPASVRNGSKCVRGRPHAGHFFQVAGWVVWSSSGSLGRGARTQSGIWGPGVLWMTAGSLGLQGGELKILVVSGTWCWRLWPSLGPGARLLGRALRPAVLLARHLSLVGPSLGGGGRAREAPRLYRQPRSRTGGAWVLGSLG